MTNKQYDKIICSKDAGEKLLAMSKKVDNGFSFYGIPVWVSDILPEMNIAVIYKDLQPQYDFDVMSYAVNWHWTMTIEIAIGECFYNCKNQLQQLKEKMFYQLGRIGVK